MSPKMVQERKRHITKPDEFYWCQELHREARYLVLRYEVTRAARLGSIDIPAGSHTLAHYWENRGYVLWEMYGPEGILIGYCYHLCLPPQIGPQSVEYLDLLLDLWFDPQGNLTVLDEDEYEEARQQGKISGDAARLVECERRRIPQDHAAILASLWRPEQVMQAP